MNCRMLPHIPAPKLQVLRSPVHGTAALLINCKLFAQEVADGESVSDAVEVAICNLKFYSPKSFGGVLAQLVERLNGIEEVTGSNPVGSIYPKTNAMPTGAFDPRAPAARIG